MNEDDKKELNRLAQRAKDDKDPDKLVEPAQEIIRIVDEKVARIKQQSVQ